MDLNRYVIGTWMLGENRETRHSEIEVIHTAINSGVTWIDTAEMYGDGLSESLVGEAIQNYDRSDLKLITKVYPWHATPESLRASLVQSLQRLGTDYVDVYLLHWDDGSVDLPYVVKAFEEFKKEGLIHEWGVSNFDVDAMAALYAIPDGDQCAYNQVLYNLGSRGIEFDLLPWMRDNNCNLMAYSVLGHSDAFRNNIQENPTLLMLAEKYNKNVYQILMAFVAAQDEVYVISKASSVQHLVANLDGMTLKLTEEDLGILEHAFPKPEEKIVLQEI